MPHGEGIDRLRDVAADAHHGLKQQKAKGDADALTYVLQQAREANASAEDITQITGGFTKIASELLGEQGKTQRRSWHPFSWLRRADPPDRDDAQRLPAPDQQRQLPPGD
jgi:hypothetical protein